MHEHDVFINADMGEGIGPHSFGNDDKLMPKVDAINVACGFHAGDPQVMGSTVDRAIAHRLRVGAHPGFPDLVGFGRRKMLFSPQEAAALVRYQVGALTAFLGSRGKQLNHIKPHGSFYGMLSNDENMMRAVADVNLQYDVPFFGLAGTAHESICEEKGVEFIPELYVDLNYSADGALIIQREPEKSDLEVVKERVRRAIAGEPFPSVDGSDITIKFQSVCVHSDAANSPEVAAAVREVLTQVSI